MTISKTCPSCLGGGIALIHSAPGQAPEIVACDLCGGRGLLDCLTCFDTGWVLEMDGDGEYVSEYPCHCPHGIHLDIEAGNPFVHAGW